MSIKKDRFKEYIKLLDELSGIARRYVEINGDSLYGKVHTILHPNTSVQLR